MDIVPKNVTNWLRECGTARESDKSPCPICLCVNCEYTNGVVDRRILLPCNHVYHLDCAIQQFNTTMRLCGLCMRDYSLETTPDHQFLAANLARVAKAFCAEILAQKEEASSKQPLQAPSKHSSNALKNNTEVVQMDMSVDVNILQFWLENDGLDVTRSERRQLLLEYGPQIVPTPLPNQQRFTEPSSLELPTIWAEHQRRWMTFVRNLAVWNQPNGLVDLKLQTLDYALESTIRTDGHSGISQHVFDYLKAFTYYAHELASRDELLICSSQEHIQVMRELYTWCLGDHIPTVQNLIKEGLSSTVDLARLASFLPKLYASITCAAYDTQIAAHLSKRIVEALKKHYQVTTLIR